jgi:hypothetical protein
VFWCGFDGLSMLRYHSCGWVFTGLLSWSWACEAGGVELPDVLSGAKVNDDVADRLLCRGAIVLVSCVLLGGLEGQGEVLDVT